MVGMAKVFKAGTISVGGDKIRLTAGAAGQFNFTNSEGSDLFSTAIYASEVSSLAHHQNLDTVQRSSDISSLDIVKDSEVSSLNAATLQRSSDISSLDIVKDSEVSSLNAATLQRSSDISSLDIVKDSEVSSLNAALGSLDSALQVTTANVSNSVNTQTFTWTALFGANSGFNSSTTVMVMLKAAQGADLIACQLAGVTNSGFTVDFSEDTGTGDIYDLVVMASN